MLATVRLPSQVKEPLSLTFTLRRWQLSHASEARVRGTLSFIAVQTGTGQVNTS